MIKKLFVADGLPNHPSRDMAVIDYVTIHETGNFNATATAAAHARFQYNGGGGRAASWHYTVDVDEVWQSFRDTQMCWHTGTWQGNQSSIGIEICVNSRFDFKEACVKSARLTADLLGFHGLNTDNVVQHHFWSGKDCPRQLRHKNWNLDWDWFMDLVSKFFAESNTGEVAAEGEEIIETLRAFGVSFNEEHWRGVFNGNIVPVRKWTEKLLKRVFDVRWYKTSPKEIRRLIRAAMNLS